MVPQMKVEAYESIRSWISDRCGISYPDHKRDLLLQRLSRVQRAFSYDTLELLAHNLVIEPRGEVELAVISAASTNHTYFFREPEILNAVRDIVLPELVKRDEIRIWSAACSTGDEVFTIGMLMDQAFGAEVLAKTSMLGTDISAPVIDRAELGVVGERQLANVPVDLRSRYLSPVGLGQYRVDDRIRRQCTFRRMNLCSTPYPFRNNFQVVFARNVLYYFEPSVQRDTLKAIYDVTENGGVLITSVTESIRDLDTPWQFESNGIYRKRLT